MTRVNEWIGKSPMWKLIHKSTVHGFRAADFHRNCDNKGETLGIIQSSNGYLFGWWTPRAWTSSNSWVSDSTTIIFTLTNPAGIPAKYANNNSQYSTLIMPVTGRRLVSVTIYMLPITATSTRVATPIFRIHTQTLQAAGTRRLLVHSSSQCRIWKYSL